jgi:hypothetical protein
MSILAVDFGSVHTRAVLIDQIGGVFELVGFARTRTTDTFPSQNVKVGLDRVLVQLTEVTGRKFVGQDGAVITPESPDRSGVDTFVVTASGGRPLRAVVIGLMPELSVRAALDTLSNTYADVVNIVTLQDGRTADERLNTVLHSYPDLILIGGGTDGGASQSVLELVQAVKMAVSVTDKRRRPTVIYAGNAALGEKVSALFEGVGEVLHAPNIRPQAGQINVGPARAFLSEAFNRYSAARGMGFAELASISAEGVLPSARGYIVIASYIAKLRGERVVALDIGSAASVLAFATPKTSDFSIRADIGVGHNAPNLLSAAGVDAIRRWLPFEADSSDIHNFVTNKSLRPGIVPYSLREAYLEQALMKVAVSEIARRSGLSSAPLVDTVIVGGAPINETGHPGYSALLAIDALGLRGVTKIWGDPYGLTAALGAVAGSRAEAVAQIVDGTGYTLLATTLCISGNPRFDKPAVQITIEPEGGQKTTFTVNGGHLTVFPLALGERATVRFKVLGRGLDIGGKRSLRLKLTGGGAGIIIDARGRPLPLDLPAAQKAALMPLWIAEVTGDEPREIGAQLMGKIDLRPPTPSDRDGDGDEPSRVRQRQTRREQRRRPTQEVPIAGPEESIEDLRNALS